MTTKPATLLALRAQLRTADPLRPNVARMGCEELTFLLQYLAEGGSPWTADDAEPALPLTRAGLDRAASARGSVSMGLTDAWVAGFLAATN